MYRSILIPAMITCLASVASGCATVVRGTSESIQVGSIAEGAECVFTRQDKAIGKVVAPGSIRIERSNTTILVLCKKDGYADAREVFSPVASDFPVGGPSLLLFPLLAVGAVVDSATGANHKYQTSLVVKLEPLPAR